MARQSLTLGFFCVRHGHGFAVLNGPRSLRFSIWAVRRACFGYGGGRLCAHCGQRPCFKLFFLIVINAILRGAGGDTQTPMRITALVNVINILGNTVFIYGLGPIPAMGVAGAALGTAVAQPAAV